MNKMLLAVFLFTAPLFGNDLSSDISSDHASFDGDFLHLEGNVKLDHDLGKMRAKKASLKKSEKELPFSEVQLRENVSLFFQNQSELYCDQAHLDFLKHQGKVFSNDDWVLYRHTEDDPFDLYSHQIDFEFDREDQIESLLAQGGVHIDFNETYHLDSDSALFKEDTLSAFGEALCHLTHFEDTIDAKRIRIHLQDRLLTMEHPQGKISSFFFPDAPNRQCLFSSSLLVWDDQTNTMTLEKDVMIRDDSLGALTGDETIRFFQKEQFGSYVIQRIESEGRTTIQTDAVHAFTSFGRLILDRDTLLLTADSPQVEGQTPLEKQLIYENGDLTLFANEGLVEYNFLKMGLEPTSVDLSGQVRLLAHGETTPFRCGFADEIHYDPQTGYIRLLAQPNHRVLFWHEEQNLKLSAQEILVIPDPETKKDTIKGVGSVSFSFNEDEQEVLHSLFPNYKRPPYDSPN